MAVVTSEFQIQTQGFSQVVDITPQIDQEVRKGGIGNGFVLVFIPGSTAGITTIEFEPGAVADLQQAIERMVPQGIHYDHDARWGDGNGFSHVRAALLGASYTVPLSNYRMMLGTWQQIVLVDFDNRGRNRKVVVQIQGE